MKTIAAHWPLAAALLLFVALQWVLCSAAVHAADGHLVYPLDDTYIQMAIGKNVAAHGVWGVTRYEFSGAGSSLAWPLLLASVNRSVGLDERTPFTLNVVAAVTLLGLAYAVLRRYVASRMGQVAALALLVLAAPLAVLTLIGMEHTLQAVATLALAAVGVRLCAASTDRERRLFLGWTLLAAAATVAVRYDAASVLAMVILVALVTGGWRCGAWMTLCGAAPAAVYALVARVHGWPMLPSSVLLKQRLGGIDMLTWRGLWNVAGGGAFGLLLEEPALFALVFAALGQLAWGAADAGDQRARERRLLLVVFIGAALLHVQFGLLGWLYRYEAYLIVLGIVANAAGLGSVRFASPGPWGWIRQRAAGAALAVLVVFPLLQRSLHATRDVPAYIRDLYRHEYQVGQFFRRYPVDGALLASDVGMLGYFSDAPIVDVDGLATFEFNTMARRNIYDGDLVLRVARQRRVQVSIAGNPFGAWTCVAEWRPTGDSDSDDKLFFYAVDAAPAARLERDLKAFAAEDSAHVIALTFAQQMARPCPARP